MQRNFCSSVDGEEVGGEDEVERGEGACEGGDGVVLGRRGQALAERAGQAQAAEGTGAGGCSGQAQAVEAAACGGGGGREEGGCEYSLGEHPDLFEESMVDEFAGLFQDSDSD